MQAILKAPKVERENRDVSRRESVRTRAETWRPSDEAIARRAYEIWQRHGCPAGTAFQDWLAAETELRLRH